MNQLNENKEGHDALMRRAYMLGLSLKNSGLDEEVILARLEKQGIPDIIALKVVCDLMLEQDKKQIKSEEPLLNITFIKIGVGFFLAFTFSMLYSRSVLLSIGVILVGIVLAIAMKDRIE